MTANLAETVRLLDRGFGEWLRSSNLEEGHREFGQWVEENVHSQLARAPSFDDRTAAMWAAAMWAVCKMTKSD